jgi:hypothetical protein
MCQTLERTLALALARHERLSEPPLGHTCSRLSNHPQARLSNHPVLTLAGQTPLLSSGELSSARHHRPSLGQRGQLTLATSKLRLPLG